VRIRSARPSESEELTALALAAKTLWGYSEQQLALWSGELRISPESIVSQPTFVVEEHARSIGVAQLDTKSQPWAVECLWVHPSAVRRGVGVLLVQHLMAHAQANGQSELRIDADPNAEGFYLHMGARRVGEVVAPIDTQPNRIRPQLMLSVERAA
jgi:ribosomal protein S18 acetylase RimI-like enzyme